MPFVPILFLFPNRSIIWFLWVGFMPLPLAKPAITWLYAPQQRPKLVNWTVRKLRTLVS